MGKKKNNNKNLDGLAVPSTKLGGGKYARDSDASDLESIAYSSVAGDLDQHSIEDEEMNDMILVDSFGEQVENAQDKKIAIRMKAISNICVLLKRSGIVGTVEKWKLTLCEIVEKNLKRTPEEAVNACSMAALLCLQLGVDLEEDLTDCICTMKAIVLDASASEAIRSLCAQTLGTCVYLSCEQFSTRYDTLQTLKEAWASMKPAATLTSLFSSAISAWVLLLERCDPGLISQIINEVQPKICSFLESPFVEVRISAGEALAVLFEIAVDDIDEDFRFSNHNHLKNILEQLALDSAKYHAKRDKKVQKISFRQVNDVIFNNQMPHSQVKFNKREILRIESCHSKLLYDLLCLLLKSDLNKHLSTNEVLRQIFDLGPALESDEPVKSKEEKAERMNLLGAVSKARNIHRAKQRDKKTC